MAATTIAEVAFRNDVAWRPVAVVVGLILALTMLWRRRHPLAMAVLAFGVFAIVDVAAAAAVSKPFSLYAGACVVILVYAVFRWATGWRVAIGLAAALVEWVVSTSTNFTGAGDAVGGAAVLLFAAALGAAVRYRRIVRDQQFERVRSQEREMLARELHDTVAHHVSAIAIQAQAGRLLAGSGDRMGAAEALLLIEREASRSLSEMRSMVRSLRRADGAPQHLVLRGLADIDDLGTDQDPCGLRIEIERHGELDDLPPAVEAALYRIAQESVTNAKRHARHASRIRVVVTGDREAVLLSVSDDGDHGVPRPRTPGYGLVGMAERVALLGGTLEVGAGAERGWTVRAAIPRQGVTA